MPPTASVIYGANASGKTSVLEALYMLGTGRSFRTHKAGAAVMHGEEALIVHGEMVTQDNLHIDLGIQRNINGHFTARVAKKNIRANSELAHWMPMQLISPDTLGLIRQSPGERRKFIDLGLFHIDLDFQKHWSQYNKCLKQRNSWLKTQSATGADLASWDNIMVRTGEAISALREQYVEQFIPVFQKYSKQLLEYNPIHFQFLQGWNKKQSLQEALLANESTDKALGYTQSGPHRADLAILWHDHNARDVISRGQEKLIVCAMKFAQASILQQKAHKHSLFLIDDLASELDIFYLSKTLSALQKLDSQCLLTALNTHDLNIMTEAGVVSLDQSGDPYWSTMFHMEQLTGDQ